MVLMTLGTAMVAWFVVRMCAGASIDVWRVSCFLGACAPLASAAALLYIQRVGDREDSVLAAWLVRAIGMHFVLAWLLGVSDWLRGPPGASPTLNADMVAPLVLASFFPVFGVGFVSFRWLLSVRARLSAARPPATRTVDLEAHRVPYRGALRLRVTESVAGFPTALVVTSALGAASVLLALAGPWSTAAVLGVTAVTLGALSTLGAPAVLPSVASLVCVAGALLTRHLSTHTGSYPLACAWPWVALAGVGVYLGTVEAVMRLPARYRIRPAIVTPTPPASVP